MPRVLVCLDATPASDGSCVEQAWMQINTIPEFPTVEQGQTVGFAIFASLVLLASMSLFVPRRSSTDE